MRRSIITRLLAVLFISGVACQSSGSKCPKDYQECKGIGEPFLMCCLTGSTCLATANNTTKICCRPDQNGCVDLAPLPCDLQNQNSTLFPSSLVSTSLLDGLQQRETCGEDESSQKTCCPFGYGCDPNLKGRCRRKADQVNWKPAGGPFLPIPGQPSSTASSATKPTSTADSTATASALPSTSDNPSIPALPVGAPDDAPPKFPAPAILAGFFPGLALGIFLAVSVLCCLGARRHKRQPRISSPKYAGSEFGGRSDFIRTYHPPSPVVEAQAPPKTPETGMKRVKSMFRKSLAPDNAFRGLGLGMGLPATPAPLRPMPPTGAQRLSSGKTERQPSEVSINVWADPVTASAGRTYQMAERPGSEWTGNGRPQTSQTTFTDLMDRELSNVEKNGYVIPRGRVHEQGDSPSLQPTVYTPTPSPGHRRLV